jgi:multidrug resistance efflux pump
MHKFPRKLVILPILLLVAGSGYAWWMLSGRSARAETGPLAASGTIESTQVIVAPQVGGQVVEVLAQNGEEVQAGQVLVRFSDTLLEAQLVQAQAAFAQAEANYNLVAAGAPDEQQQLAIAAAQLELVSAQQALDELYTKNALAAAQAAKTVADSRDLVRDAERINESLNSPASQTDIDIAKSLVTLTETAMERAEKRLKPLLRKSEDNPKRAASFLVVSLLEKQHDLAIKRLNYLEGGADEITLAQAEAALQLAQENLKEAERQSEELAKGPDPDLLELAKSRLNVAKAKLAAAKAGPTQEQLALAQSQVEMARAAMGVIEAQMAKLNLTAPSDGIVLSRSVEAGEVVAPGAPLLTLGRLDNLTITVYIPEDRYGNVSIGQTARVSVDSFPGQEFTASVARIADQAEFTPRNVQTQEGRRTTVFALELIVEDPDGWLKPGMPADVTFDDV